MNLPILVIVPLAVCLAISCRSNYGPNQVETDPRSKALLHSTWDLLSRDSLDSTAEGIFYLNRQHDSVCSEIITFQDSSIIEEEKSCLMSGPTALPGSSHWYKNQPIDFIISLFIDSTQGYANFRAYRILTDTLQFEGFPNSNAAGIHLVRTYILRH